MTYKKIAQLANVSLSTVSKALAGSKEVSEELTQKIIQIAMEQGYFEKKGKRKIEYTKNHAVTVAIICPELISLSYAWEITAFKNEIEARGGLAAVYVYDFDATKLSDIIQKITVRNCADGMIIYPPADFVSIPRHSIPIVGITTSHSAPYDTICCDIDAYMHDIVRYCKSLGHKQIAFVGEPHTMEKFYAYQKSLDGCGLPSREEDAYIIDARFEQIGYRAAEEMLQTGKIPTAVICAYDEIALAMMHRFAEHGIHVPEQVSVIGINDIPMAAYAQTPLTTVRTFQEEMGMTAVNLLYDKIFQATDMTQHITIKHELVIRKSSAAPYRQEG